ncbi:MAG: hypothetical protein WA104_07855 [Thermodesulfovibrionales bacterium]
MGNLKGKNNERKTGIRGSLEICGECEKYLDRNIPLLYFRMQILFSGEQMG